MTRHRNATWSAWNFLVLFAAIFAGALPTHGWEPQGHRLVATATLQSLPSALRPWFSGQEAAFVQASLEPDLWKVQDAGEVWRHRITCEAYGGPEGLPLQETEAQKRLGAFAFEQAGQLPWVIAEHHQRLVAVFKARDLRQVVAVAGWLCHYTADAQVPLHTTRDRNGKATGQKGVHKRWEGALVAYGVDVLPAPAEAEPLSDIATAIVTWIGESHALIPFLLEADRQASKDAQGNPEAHTRAFWLRQRHQVLQQLNRAADRSGALIVSAWVQAGRPRP